ncbi:GNAT family N-acetyltransferase [Curtobacterium sp. L1-20]|uniref:GNAT family N-acetyltransferase n=1 Tax=Curtobacterium sp. L1-20 TaxID=3138181 RepID=UPI003B52C79B
MAHSMVRPARESDTAGIAAVHVQAWREAYAHLMPATFLAGLDQGRRETGWRTIIADEVTDVLVALDGEKIIGWASAGSGRDGCAPTDRELEGIYVLAAAYGSGAGQQLLDAAIGDEPAFLWMADNNPRAEAFYRRNRFERDGAEKTESFGGASVRVVRLTR